MVKIARNILICIVLGLALETCHPYLRHVPVAGETAPVGSSGDAADDMAVYVDLEDGQKSILVGTDKQRGLELYDLEGRLLQSFPLGRINNVDIARIAGSERAWVGGSNRTDNTIALYFLQKDPLELIPASASPAKVAMSEVYGFCWMAFANEHYAVVSGTEGEIEIFRVSERSDKTLEAILWRQFKLPGQTEGLVFDRIGGQLYLAEENGGIWRWDPAQPGQDAQLLIPLSEQPHFKADLEGLAIYYAQDQIRYLLVSSQGNHRYGVFEIAPNGLDYQGVFRTQATPKTDASQETDGIEIVSCPLGSLFPSGILLVQDGKNTAPGQGRQHQNFKIIDWRDIAGAFSPPLEEKPDCNH
ncbi:MAG: phytase [Saprospiraceae bacterium]|nr:phytase [Saprospiraceae bacterium]